MNWYQEVDEFWKTKRLNQLNSWTELIIHSTIIDKRDGEVTDSSVIETQYIAQTVRIKGMNGEERPF